MNNKENKIIDIENGLRTECIIKETLILRKQRS